MKTLYTFFILLLLVSQTALHSQHSLLIPMSSTVSEVATVLQGNPALTKKSGPDEMVYGNDLFEVRYNFDQGMLNKTFFEHKFDEEEMAKMELMGYLTKFQKSGATVLPLFKGKKVSIFYAYQNDTHIEIIYRKFSRNDYSVKVKLYEGASSDVQLLTQASVQ